MGLPRIGRLMAGCAAMWALSASASPAQEVPWVLFPDSRTLAACEVVNADDSELVVLTATGELVLVSGSDVIIDGTFVDIDAAGPPWFVFLFGDPVGVIDFATDGDGFRTLWWLSLTGTVVHVDGFTGEPIPTDLLPTDFVNVPCEAADFWDGCLSDLDCADGDECTVDICNGGVCESAPILGCSHDGGGDSGITFNFCGMNTGLPLALMTVGLGLTGLVRRRFG